MYSTCILQKFDYNNKQQATVIIIIFHIIISILEYRNYDLQKQTNLYIQV